MQLKSNIPELIDKLERFKAAVINGGPPGSFGTENLAGAPGNISDALISALNAGMGKMKFRIFNKGLDADGNSLGVYSKCYGKKRLQHGRQALYKDLEMDGSLRRSIETVRVDNNQAAIAITNEETAKISFFQEEQIGRIRNSGTARIFELSDSELNQAQEEADAAVAQVIKKLFDEA